MNEPQPCESCRGHGVIAAWHNYASGDGDYLTRPCKPCRGTGVVRPPTRPTAPAVEGEG